MPQELFNALPAAALFALVTTITPGPNNTMLLASGVNFGLKRTLPHVLGISTGVAILMIAVGLGLAQAFERLPWLYTVLEAASVAYLLYLAWKIGTSSSVQLRDGQSRPMRFHEAIAFQWINPKAWMMVLTAATTIHLHASLSLNAALMALVLVVIGLPCITMWAAFGMSLRRFLANPRWLRMFNLSMALLLVLSLYPIVAHFSHDAHQRHALCRIAGTGAYWSDAPARKICRPACKFGAGRDGSVQQASV